MDKQAQHSSSRKKRIALFLDGTWNTVKDDTNVWRAKLLCARQSADGAPQVAYYSEGVGTKFGEKIRGGMFGYGIDTEITDAYEWLIENYAPGDEIFVFGFSRGAYTARSLAGLISRCGLVVAGAPLSVRQIYSRYRKGDGVRTIRNLLDDHTRPRPDPQSEDGWVVRYSRPVDVYFIGVWDTVGSLGVPDLPWIKWGREPFLDTNLRRSEGFAFHALAIDEHRKAFAPTLWTKYTPIDPSQHVSPPRPITSVEQRWFIGAHANVGGGYVNDPLAQKPLDWMVAKASQCGLAFTRLAILPGDLDGAPIEDSFAEFGWGLYKIYEMGQPYFRKIGRPPGVGKTTVHETINETIDSSVFDRWRSRRDYRPPNLSDWSNRFQVDIEAITSSVLANSPSTAVSD